MADTDKRLAIRFEATNKDLIRKLEQNQREIKNFETATGRTLKSAANDFRRFGGDTAASSKKVNSAFGVMGRQAGQAGIQIQQLVGQVQGGTNALVAISQQVPDLGIVLGAPLIGALVGIAGAIGTFLLPNLFSSKSAVDDLNASLKILEAEFTTSTNGAMEFNNSLRELQEVSRVAVVAQLTEAMLTAETAISSARREISKMSRESGVLSISFASSIKAFEEGEISARELADSYDQYFIAAVNAGAITGENQSQFREFRKELAQLVLGSEEAEKKLERLSSALDIGVATKDEFKAQQDLLKFQEKIVDEEAKMQNDRLGNLQKAFFAIESQLRSEEEVLKDTFNKRLATINAFESKYTEFTSDAEEARKRLQIQYAEDEKEILERRLKEKQRIKDAEDRLRQSAINSTQAFIAQSLDTIQQGMDQESDLAKVAFAAQKTVAISNAIVATEQAAAQALTLGPIAGPPISAAIRGLGYASVGIIAGQTLASFEGGGLTPPGPRAGGMDGKGGQLAMLHPNEKVIDLNKQDTSPGWKVEVNNYGNDQVSTNIDDEQRIVSVLVNQAGNPTSQFRKSLHGTSNVLPRGSRR